jgi:uncharacterized protein YjiS (DUF1127 family)
MICTESNVLIVRRILEEHYIFINPIAPVIARCKHWRPDMTATLSTILRPAGTKSPAANLRIFTACWQGIARYFIHRAAIAHLRELDDDALRDIGLVRSKIEAAVRGVMTAPNRARI